MKFLKFKMSEAANLKIVFGDTSAIDRPISVKFCTGKVLA